MSARSHPPEATVVAVLPRDVKRYLASKRDTFVDALWASSDFHEGRSYVRARAWAYAQHDTELAAEVLEHLPLTTRAVVSAALPATPAYFDDAETFFLAVAAAYPGVHLRGYDAEWNRFAILLTREPRFTSFAADLRVVALDMCRRVGHAQPGGHQRVWASIALVSLAETRDALREALPLFKDLVYNPADGSMTVGYDPARPKGHNAHDDAMREHLASSFITRPESDFNPSGRSLTFVSCEDLNEQVDAAIRTLLAAKRSPQTVNITTISQSLAVNRDTLSDALKRWPIDLKKRALDIENSVRKLRNNIGSGTDGG